MMLLGTGAVATKTYVDDIFSTFVYAGNTSGQSINNGIDLAGEGALTWIKQRNGGAWHQLYDTERGATKALYSNGNDAEATVNAGLTAFNNNGFTLSNHGGVSTNGNDYSSWTFRKAPGFFDVVTYTGNGVDGRSLSHSLGSIPGMWMVKRTDGTANWVVGHSKMLGGTGDDYKWHVHLNNNVAKDINGEFTYNSPPTSTTLRCTCHL